MVEAVRVLLVGAGRMGRVHLDVLEAARSATPTAVVEPVESVRDELAGRGLATHATLQQAVDAGGFDAALVAAPSRYHFATVRQLIEARVPTLCEKPCGLQSDETAQLAEQAADQEVVLQVGYWRRFVPALRELKARVGAGELGDVSLAQAWQWDATPPAADFRRNSGGIVRDMGVHEIDQLRWLTGEELLSVRVVESDVCSDPPVPGDPESAALVGMLSGGGIAFVSLGRRYDKGDACWVELIGTRRSARCEFMAGAPGDEAFRAALAAQLDAFGEAVRGAAGDGATAADAVAALRTAEAVRPMSP